MDHPIRRLPRNPDRLGRPVRWPLAAALAVVTGLAGVYYAFFTCYFLAVAAASRCAVERSSRPAGRAAAIAATIFATLMLALSPAIVYQRRHSANPDAPARSPGESEILAFKMVQLVAPVPGHRIPRFAEFTRNYDQKTPLNNENRMACLGMAAALGFGYLTARLLFFRGNAAAPAGTAEGDKTALLDLLALLSMAGFLLGSVGAFGSLFSFLVSPWVRAYNRISIFLGLFSVVALAALADRFLEGIARPKRRLLAHGLLPLLGLACLWEQTTEGMVPEYGWLEARYRGDRQFVAEIEANTEPGRMVYEMPYRYFPEAPGEPPGIRFTWYDLMRPLVHSKTLTWSFGSPRGRYGDLWVQQMERKRLEERLLALADIPCAGVMIFRAAYEDHGEDIEGRVAALLRTRPIVSPDREMAFYSLDKLSAQRLELLGPDEAEKIRRQELYPVLPMWGLGVGRHERDDYTAPRYCQSGCELRLANRDTAPRKVRLRLEARLTKPHPDTFLTLRDGAANPRFPISELWTTIEQDFTVPPGEMLLHIDCGTGNHFDAMKVECVDQ